MGQQMKFALDANEQLTTSREHARRTDPYTSRKAARIKKGGVRARILKELIAANNGLATWEIALLISKPRDSVSPNMVKLKELGLVHRSSQVRINPATNQETEVWQANKEACAKIAHIIDNTPSTSAKSAEAEVFGKHGYRAYHLMMKLCLSENTPGAIREIREFLQDLNYLTIGSQFTELGKKFYYRGTIR
jgi:post-segregation antitoxin (ccd killing protein)